MESSIFGIGEVVDEVCKARMEATVAATEVESANGMIRLQAASFFVQAEASATKAVEVMEWCV